MKEGSKEVKAFPHPLLDAIVEEYGLKNDARITKLIGISHAQVSKIRHGKICVSAEVKLAIIRELGWSIKRIDQLCPPKEKKHGDAAAGVTYGRRATDRAVSEARQPGAAPSAGDGSNDAEA